MGNPAQTEQMHKKPGFVAALDQSGGSTPKALGEYGITPDAWSNDEEMFELMHKMRTRIVSAPAFQGDKVIGAILFERTMDGMIAGKSAPDFIWQDRGVVPFLKIDKGLADAANGVKMMKPMPGLDDLLKRGVDKGIFGTKERSVIDEPNEAGIKAIVAQQFEVGEQVLAHGLVPILEPEVTITAPEKAACEDILKAELAAGLETVSAPVMIKISIPTKTDLYRDLMDHPKVLRVIALSGGYARDEANQKLAQNKGLIASFSRALVEGLSAQQSDDDFNATIGATIDSIYQASIT